MRMIFLGLRYCPQYWLLWMVAALNKAGDGIAHARRGETPLRGAHVAPESTRDGWVRRQALAPLTWKTASFCKDRERLRSSLVVVPLRW